MTVFAVVPQPGDTWACGAFQPVSPRRSLKPYRCTEPYGHTSDHRAVIDGEVVAQWPRKTQ